MINEEKEKEITAEEIYNKISMSNNQKKENKL